MGKVTSYGEYPLRHSILQRIPSLLCIGHIAKLIGMPRHSRHVGQGSFVPFPAKKEKKEKKKKKTTSLHLIILTFDWFPIRGGLGIIALKFISPDTNPPIPWQRVISSSGMLFYFIIMWSLRSCMNCSFITTNAGTISSRGPGTQGAQIQKQILETEGIQISDSLHINLSQYGWFPPIGSVDVGVQGLPGVRDVEEGEVGEGEGWVVFLFLVSWLCFPDPDNHSSNKHPFVG